MSLPLPASDDASLNLLIEAARTDGHSVGDVAALARHLAASGMQFEWPSASTVDVASTGGPGSLSTLLPPLVLVAGGCSVVKLAVPGRPAGAIDALGTIPGYRTRLTAEEVRAAVSACGFAHFLADQRFAPLDARLFALRKKVGAVAIPILAVASLLSKKLAVGIMKVGLDVRVGRYGNLGATRELARQNARFFCAVARAVGIDAVAFLSAPDALPQPWIGRGESLVALAAAIGLRPLEDSWLQGHIDDCLRMASVFSTATRPVREVLETHLDAQGSSMQHFLDRVDEVASAERTAIHIENSGILEVDLARVRDVVVGLQADDGGEFRDPAGVRFVARPGCPVSKGDVVAFTRGLDGDNLKSMASALVAAEGSPRHIPAMEIVYA